MDAVSPFVLVFLGGVFVGYLGCLVSDWVEKN